MYTHNPYYNMNQYRPHYRSTYKNRFEMGFISGLLDIVPLPVIIGGVLLVIVIGVAISLANRDPKYVGCYQDGAARILPANHHDLGVSATREQCNEKAKASKHKYFGLQYWQGDNKKETGQCFSGNKLPKNTINGCKSGGKYSVGGAWENAVYKTK